MNFKLKTMQEKLKYFKIAKELNDSYHSELLEKELHFRGNFKSLSLVSLSQKHPEMGKSGIKTKKTAEKTLNNITLNTPGRLTREKHLQAHIIKESLLNENILPFGDFTFLCSEIAFPTGKRTRIVNDILALDKENTLIIIELKSIRDSKVIKQTSDFEKEAVNKDQKIFEELILLMSGRQWNKKIRRIAVWPVKNKRSKSKTYNIDELYGYEMTNCKQKGTLLEFENINYEREN